MEYGFGTERYYKKMLELQDKLRKSEEERLKLEEKFNEMMQMTRDAEHDRLRIMRHRYHKFLEEDKARQERNENILQALDRIDSRAKMLAAKTSRFKAFRKQYESYIKRIYRIKTDQQPSFQNTAPSQSDRAFPHSNVRKKLFSDLPASDESVESKLAMLEQYLRDNFDNFPRELPQKSLNGNRIEENAHEPSFSPKRTTFYNQNNYDRPQYFDPPDSDSKESQDVIDDYNKYPMRPFNGNDAVVSPTKGELLGNTIEKELERLKKKEPIKPLSPQKSFEQPEKVIQDYKELVSKSEEKYGLRDESPVRKNINENKESPKNNANPNLFDNATKTVNITELKNISGITPEIVATKSDSESENPVIKNYKKMVKSLQEEIPPIENLKVIDSNNQDNSEHSKKDDNSERTEPPSDISLNFSSHKSEELPVEQIPAKQNGHQQENVESIHETSVDDSTIKEQLQIKPDTVQKIPAELETPIQLQQPNNVNKNNSPQDEQVYEEYSQQGIAEQPLYNEQTYDTQNYPPENQPEYGPTHQIGDQPGFDSTQLEYDSTQPGYDPTHQVVDQPGYDPTHQVVDQPGYDPTHQVVDQPGYQDQYDVSQQNIVNQPEYQENYEQQHIAEQPVYQEGYDQNIPESGYPEDYNATQQPNVEQPGYHEYDQQNTSDQPIYPEGYEQQNMGDQPAYPEGYEQQNMGDQSAYPEGYDHPNVVDQQGYDQQHTGEQPGYQEGYDQQTYPEGYEQNIPQQSEFQDSYETQSQNPTDPNYQQEYDPQYYPEQQNQPEQAYDQQYTEGQPYPEGYDPQYQEYPEQEYQPQEYPQEYPDQQYPQEQTPESVYRSEQEYIQGEQSIDKQYESEQNTEYPEGYVGQDNQNLEQIQPQQPEVESNVTLSESTEKSSSEVVGNKPILEKKLPNIADMLDTDTSESVKQEAKVSNGSDFDFSK